MRCASCGFENPEGMKFCGECAAPFKSHCPQCGFANPPGFKFCGQCSTPLALQPGVTQSTDAPLRALAPARPEAERRQLTVMFCDLVGSTALSAQVDPEDLRQLVRQYQQTCAEVIQRHEGHIAQYLGDGLLVYFGYPTAHEDDARRAVRTGLEIIEALKGQARPQPLQVRIGIHTGLVVIGEIGGSGRTEQLAVGETPNVAARIQGLAEPDTIVVSAATHRLIDSQFESQPFGSHRLKGIDTLIAIYHVQGERQLASSLAGKATLTPLVGREQEMGLLSNRWEQVKEGRGQVVLLSGEPGIGKSRLAYTLREHVIAEGSLLFEARCSPYHQHSALYPLIEVLQRTVLLTRQDTDDEKVDKLERALALYGLQETVPLFTALLSLPTPAHYPALTLTPQKQKERTLQALLEVLIAQAERQATVSVWEDLHWVDPSSLEFLSLLIEQIPTSKLLLVLTFRPEFIPPWKPRSHLTQITLNRLGKRQVEAMIEKVTQGNVLPAEVIEQIRAKTDGVPLFVEELTKSVIEARVQSTGNGGRDGKTGAGLGIPTTLQEALLARLDRLSTARQIAQLGATLGREFSYELLYAVTPLGEPDLQTDLSKLVEAEILYQRGVGEQAQYFFKHALIQDTAYQSLLKSTRQQYHKQIAQVLEERFPEAKETQPELLAHHYTEAGLIAWAIPHWQQAGQRASERSANVEAVGHLTKGLELLKALPDALERTQQELTLQVSLGRVQMAVKGQAAPEVAQTYARALALCQQIGETPQLFPVLAGLRRVYVGRGNLPAGRALGEQLLGLAQRAQDPAFLVEAHYSLGNVLFWQGEFDAAYAHMEQGMACSNLQQSSAPAFSSHPDIEAAVGCYNFAAFALWFLGYPHRALKKSHEALTLARDLSRPHNLAQALSFAALLHVCRREGRVVQEHGEGLIALCTEQRFPFWLAGGHIVRGWAVVEQGQGAQGVAEIHEGMAAKRATGAELAETLFLALLAEAYRKIGQTEEGLSTLAEALALVDKTGERYYEAELYRLKGELMLQQSNVQRRESEAEECFLKALDIAHKQQAKSLELRAVMSLARLWQRQGKQHEARNMLAEIYTWFTEGFDTKDLQEAKTLLDELSEDRRYENE